MFSQDSTLIGDVDCSGEVNSQDASLILQFVTNVIDSLPCEANMTGLTPDQLQEMIDMMQEQLSINYTGGSGNVDNLRFPEGISGDILNITLSLNTSLSYTIPSGKRLYITKIFSWSESMYIDGILIIENVGQNSYRDIFSPIIINSNQVVSIEPMNENLGTLYFNGLLVDEKEEFEGVTLQDLYTVPDGKSLFINYASPGSSSIQLIDDLFPSGVNIHNVGTVEDLMLPLMFNSNQQIDFNSNIVNGYLVDEDYFSSAGSGSIGNGTENENNQNEDGSIVGSPVDNSEVDGTRIYYIDNNSIMETDEFGSFSNTIYEPGGGNVIHYLYVDESTQSLYWAESVASNSGWIKKSSLNNFTPENVASVFDENFSVRFNEMWVSSTGTVYYSIGNNIYNNVNNNSNVLYQHSQTVYSFCVDEELDQLFFSDHGEVFDTNTGSSLWNNAWTYPSLVCHSDDKIYFAYGETEVSSMDYSGDNLTTIFSNTSVSNFKISDMFIFGDENPLFFFGNKSVISKYSSEIGWVIICPINTYNSLGYDAEYTFSIGVLE